MYINKTIILCNKQNKAIGLCKLERYQDQTSYELKINEGNPPFNIVLQTPSSHLFLKTISNETVGQWDDTLSDMPIRIVGGDDEITFQGSTTGRDFYDANLVDFYYNSIATDDKIKDNQMVKNLENTDNIETKENKTQDYDILTEKVIESIETKPENNTPEIEFIGIEPEQPQDTVEEETADNNCEFFNKIQGELSKLFATYPAENSLAEQIEQSQWVKVPVDENAYYVVGLISEDGNPKYICYGVPDIDNTNPPKEKCESQWIPIENSIDNIGGYWVMFQSAKDGKS